MNFIGLLQKQISISGKIKYKVHMISVGYMNDRINVLLFFFLIPSHVGKPLTKC
jgi:hypothetical protein